MDAGTDLGTPMLGFRNKVYIATSFSWASPTWEEMETVIDTDGGEEAEGKEISIWGSNFVGEELGFEKKTKEIKFSKFSKDTDLPRLLSAKRSRTPVIICEATGDIDDADIEREIAAWIVKGVKYPRSKDDPDEVTVTFGLYRPNQFPPVYDVTT